MNKHRAQKDILYIAISSFILIAAWIGFNLFHIYTTTTISEPIQVQLVPIDPTFDQETIKKLKTRTKVQPVNELQITPSPEVTSTPTEQINTIVGQ